MALDFSDENLRGRHFKGRQDLAGANFSYADIRGANFTNTNLTGANFSHTKAGLQWEWVVGLVIASLLLASLSGLISGTASLWITYYFSSEFTNEYGFVPATIILFVYVVFFVVTIRKGFVNGAVAVTIAGTVAVVGAGAMAVAMAGGGGVVTGDAGVVSAVAGAGAAAVIGAGVATAAVAVAVAGVVAGTVAMIGTAAAAVIAAVVAVTGAIAVAIVAAALGMYIACGALAEDERYGFVRNIAISFAAIFGTNFTKANLTDVTFIQATHQNTNFQGAILIRTSWLNTQKLNLASTGDNYLKHIQLRELVITGQGQGKNFDRQNLRGINLRKANLADASFIRADLSEANLQDADLSRVKLKQTQLDGTDLTGATLTGAFIEDWGITNTTKLHGVRCEYVFMRLPTKEDPDPLRKPDNKQEVFADGDFAEFIKPIFDTLDLYHNQGVDPRAVAIAFKNLAENHPEAELEIVAMEKRGDDKILLRAKTAAYSDKSQLSAEYFDDYNQLKALSQSQQLLLVEKDKRIISLENMVDTALKQPKFYTQGDTNMSDISGINIQDSSNVSGIAGNNSIANLGTISRNVSIALNQLPDAPDAEKPGIKELLSQLQDAIIQSTYLSEEDKAEALEQVNTLAEAGKNPQESTKQKTAKTAITMLKGIFTGLPAVASLVEATNKLLPAISKLFGLG